MCRGSGERYGNDYPEPVVSTTLNAAKCSGIAIGLDLEHQRHFRGRLIITSRAVQFRGPDRRWGQRRRSGSWSSTGLLVNDVYTNRLHRRLCDLHGRTGKCCRFLGDAKIITLSITPEPVVANGLDATDNAATLPSP